MQCTLKNTWFFLRSSLLSAGNPASSVPGSAATRLTDRSTSAKWGGADLTRGEMSSMAFPARWTWETFELAPSSGAEVKRLWDRLRVVRLSRAEMSAGGDVRRLPERFRNFSFFRVDRVPAGIRDVTIYKIAFLCLEIDQNQESVKKYDPLILMQS